MVGMTGTLKQIKKIANKGTQVCYDDIKTSVGMSGSMVYARKKGDIIFKPFSIHSG